MKGKTIPRTGSFSKNGKGKGRGNHGIKLTREQTAWLRAHCSQYDTVAKAAISLSITRDNLSRLLKYGSASKPVIDNVLYVYAG